MDFLNSKFTRLDYGLLICTCPQKHAMYCEHIIFGLKGTFHITEGT